jgi:hypothetical protein
MTAFDTNVLIHSCDHADPGRQNSAFEILAAAQDRVLLWQVAVEFLAASRKLASQGFTSAQAWARLRDFMDLFQLVVPSQPVFDHPGTIRMIADLGLSMDIDVVLTD